MGRSSASRIASFDAQPQENAKSVIDDARHQRKLEGNKASCDPACCDASRRADKSRLSSPNRLGRFVSFANTSRTLVAITSDIRSKRETAAFQTVGVFLEINFDRAKH